MWVNTLCSCSPISLKDQIAIQMQILQSMSLVADIHANMAMACLYGKQCHMIILVHKEYWLT